MRWWLISSSGRGHGSRGKCMCMCISAGIECGAISLGEQLICQIVNGIHNSVKGLHLNLTIVFVLIDVKGAIIPVEKNGWSLERIASPNDIIQSFIGRLLLLLLIVMNQ
jgi:hypothetical protein